MLLKILEELMLAECLERLSLRKYVLDCFNNLW